MDTYEDALTRLRKIGASHADDAALMAGFCQDTLQLLVGAGVDSKMTWEGAQHIGLTTNQLLEMASRGWRDVEHLMWVV